MEQQPLIASPLVLEPPPPSPHPQKNFGTDILPVPPPPAFPPPELFHAWQWCYALPIALNFFMATVIALVSGILIPLFIALAGLLFPIVGYALERRMPRDSRERTAFAQRVLRWECAFYMTWEASIFLLWPASA